MSIEEIAVSIRLRPLSTKELENNGATCWEVPGPTSLLDLKHEKLYLFDRVFNESCPTEKLYEELGENFVWKAMEGYNSCIFTYGSRGSGKTFTFQGNQSVIHSLIHLSFSSIFAYISSINTWDYVVRCSYFEICNEMITDLLSPDNISLTSKDLCNLGFGEKRNLSEMCVASIDQALALSALGTSFRDGVSNDSGQAV